MVTGDSESLPDCDVLVGTEAVLHRAGKADVVAFLDLDAELLAPRYRAAEQAMALLARAARLVGGRSGGGRLLVQTFLPRHEVLQAVLHADPSRVAKVEMSRRELLGLPPFAALAAVSGAGATEFAAATGLEASSSGEVVLLRAPTWDELGCGDRVDASSEGLTSQDRGRSRSLSRVTAIERLDRRVFLAVKGSGHDEKDQDPYPVWKCCAGRSAAHRLRRLQQPQQQQRSRSASSARRVDPVSVDKPDR